MKLIGYDAAASFIDDELNDEQMNGCRNVSTLPIQIQPALSRNSDQSMQQQPAPPPHSKLITEYSTRTRPSPPPNCPCLAGTSAIDGEMDGWTEFSPVDGKSPNWDFLFISWRSISSQSMQPPSLGDRAGVGIRLGRCDDDDDVVDQRNEPGTSHACIIG